MSTNPKPDTSFARRFDIATGFTIAWFRDYVTELEKYNGSAGTTNCNVRLSSDFDNRVRFTDIASWRDYITNNWDEIAESHIWLGRALVSSATCDHRRQHVTLEVVSDNPPVIEKAFSDLGRSLSLKESPPQPYRYRRSSLEFDVGLWRPDWFVLGVKSIAAFLGGNPALLDGYAKTFEGDIEKLTPFYELEDFYASVGKRASRFEEIVIRMEARSIAVGIVVTSDHKKLRIRTSLDPDSLDEIISAWPSDLKLKPVKALDPGAGVGGGAPAPVESRLLKYGVPVLIAFLTAASTAGLISLKKAFWPDYTVVITSPLTTQGIATFEDGTFPVNWYLKPDQPSLREIVKDAPANVRVHGSGGFQHTVNGKPPVEMQLPAGNYVVQVDAPGATPAQIQVLIQPPPPPQPTQMPAKSKRR